jgi:hypothetical protein
MKKNKKEFTNSMQIDIASANESLLYLLDLLTPMEGQYRTAQEQVYFEQALNAARLLPINNSTELQRYF